MEDAIRARGTDLKIGADFRARYKAGEWDADIQAGGARGAKFEHLPGWTLKDWMGFVKRLRLRIPAHERKDPVTVQGRGGLTKSVNDALIHDARVRKIKRLREKKIEEEKALRENLEIRAPEEVQTEAAKNLEIMRIKLAGKMSIDEFLERLVGHARGDHPAMARSAMATIIDIMGISTASKANSAAPAPAQVQAIFALPEGAGGPAIR